MQDLHALGLGMLAGLDQERVLLLDEVDLVGREARDRHRDAILVLAKPLDVVGRPVGAARVGGAHRGVEQVEQAGEADGRAIQGGEAEFGSHRHILLRATWTESAGHRIRRPYVPISDEPWRSRIWGVCLTISRAWGRILARNQPAFLMLILCRFGMCLAGWP